MSVEDELEPINLNTFIGNDVSWTFTVKDENNATPNITAAKLTFTLKDEIEGTVLFQRKNSAAGGDDTEIEITDGSNGEFVLYIVQTNTISLDIFKTYYYDIEIDLVNYGLKTVAHGEFIVNGK